MALFGVVGFYFIYYIFYIFCERAVATLNVLLTYFQSEHTQKNCVYLSSAAATVNFDVGHGFVNGYLSITVL